MSHLGLYAYARTHLGLTAPCYATLPTATMGRLTTMESVISIRSEQDFSEKQSDEEKQKDVERDEHLRAEHKHWCIVTPDEVNEAFEQIITLRYLQPTQLEGTSSTVCFALILMILSLLGKCAGLALTAYSAGHTLGGAVWKLRSPSSGTLLIALDWNHIRERHIDGTALVASSSRFAATNADEATSSSGIADAIHRPDLLITSMTRASYTNARRKDRDAALLDVIHNTIRSGNSVLMPVDASARLLELLVLLDQHWAYAYPHVRFPLCLVSNTGKEMIERARTLMEWMTKEWVRHTMPSITDDDEEEAARKRQRNGRDNATASPLDFKYLRTFSSIEAMDEAIPPGDAKVVLAWPPSLTHGPARKIFTRMATNQHDVVLLTGHGESGSLGRALYDEWERQQDASAKWGKGKVGTPVSGSASLEVVVHSKVPLQGEELEKHQETIRLAEEKAAQQRALLARSTRRVEADDDDDGSSGSDSSDESDEEAAMEDAQINENGVARAGKKRGMGMADAGADGLTSPEISFDIYLKGSASRVNTFFGAAGERANGRYTTGMRFRTFPVFERKKHIDGYGETIDLSKWLHHRRQLEALGGEEAETQSQEDQQAAVRTHKIQQVREEEEHRKKLEPPSKYVTETLNVQAKCMLLFVDMEGLYDGRALKTIVPQLEPRRLILVESVDAQQRNSLHTSLSQLRSMTQDIFLPMISESIEIGETTANYTVNLGEEVLGSLRFSNFQDYQVALLRAKISFRAESSIPVLELSKEDLEEDRDTQDIDEHSESKVKQEIVELDEIDNAQRTINRQPTTLYIGDLKLSSLKQSLARVQKPSIPSEFVGQGTLVCGSGAFKSPSNTTDQDVVTVRKENQGEIIIEGNVGRNFQRVRDAVYNLHAQVTGQ